MAYTLPNPMLSSSSQSTNGPLITDPPAANFTIFPKFILVGDIVNFTQRTTGGTPPYTFSWDFGDGTPIANTAIALHRYSVPGNYTVKLNVVDSASMPSSTSAMIVAQAWPVSSYGWVVPWNLTQYNGINIWGVTYHGTMIIRDARLVAVQVVYLNNLCGPFYDQPYNMTGVKMDGNIFYSYFQNSTGPDPYFQLASEYRVGGYDYTEAYRFFKDGRWEPVLMIGRDGCMVDHIYEPHWRINLALNGDANNYMSMYTSKGTWQDLLWEGNYTDTGLRDPAHNNTIWRYGDQGRFYYLVPKVVRWDLDLPPVAADLVLVRNHPNELGLACPDCTFLQSPVQFVNGELVFRRDIAFWFVPKVYDHGGIPGLTLSLKVLTLTFYPGGVWT